MLDPPRPHSNKFWAGGMAQRLFLDTFLDRRSMGPGFNPLLTKIFLFKAGLELRT